VTRQHRRRPCLTVGGVNYTYGIGPFETTAGQVRDVPEHGRSERQTEQGMYDLHTPAATRIRVDEIRHPEQQRRPAAVDLQAGRPEQQQRHSGCAARKGLDLVPRAGSSCGNLPPDLPAGVGLPAFPAGQFSWPAGAAPSGVAVGGPSGVLRWGDGWNCCWLTRRRKT
jgi:hypothetical protein